MKTSLALLVGALALALVVAADAQTSSSRRRVATDGGAKAPAPASRPAPPGAQPGGKASPVTVDANSMESRQKEGLVIFSGDVVARQNGSTQLADQMEVYFDEKGDRIVRTVSTGNVRITTRDCKTGTARRAEYYDADQRVVLIGDARVWQDDNVVTGERITIYLAEDRSVVEAGREGGRVRGIFYPRREDANGKVESKAPAKTASCS
jgi:lipopolysaccharide export system protein LptA